MDALPEIEFTELEASEFDQAFELLSELVDLGEVDELSLIHI